MPIVCLWCTLEFLFGAVEDGHFQYLVVYKILHYTAYAWCRGLNCSKTGARYTSPQASASVKISHNMWDQTRGRILNARMCTYDWIKLRQLPLNRLTLIFIYLQALRSATYFKDIGATTGNQYNESTRDVSIEMPHSPLPPQSPSSRTVSPPVLLLSNVLWNRL